MTEKIKYRFLTFLRYFGDALFYPFFALYLENKHLGESRIGIILAITPLLGIITNPLYTALCKNVNITKRVLCIVSFIEALLIIIITTISSYPIILIIVILIALSGASHYALMDALLANYSKKNNISYASIRIFGSTAYIFASVFGGFIINEISYQVCFIIGAILFSMAGISYFFLKPIKDNHDSEEKIKKGSLKKVLKTPDFIFFCIFYMLLMGTTYASDCFLPVYMESRGINDFQFGIIFAYLVTLEVITLLIMGTITKKINPHKALFISVLCLMTRLIANYMYLPVVAIAIITGLRGIGYGIVLSVSYPYVIKILGKANWSLGIMVLLFGYSLYVGIFNVFNGIIIDLFSYKNFYLINIVITFVVLVIAAWRIFLFKKRNQQELVNSET